MKRGRKSPPSSRASATLGDDDAFVVTLRRRRPGARQPAIVRPVDEEGERLRARWAAALADEGGELGLGRGERVVGCHRANPGRG